MMQSWKREQFGCGRVGMERGRPNRPNDELELSKMDTIIMQVSKVSRNIAEVNESCMCLEELISKEVKKQDELESELKTSSTLNPLRNQQHALTKINLQASIQLIKDQTEREHREKRRLEEELDMLLKRMEKVKESKLSQLSRIKAHYGVRLVTKEKIEQQKKLLQLNHDKNVLNTNIMQLKQEQQMKQAGEWKKFVEAMIKVAKLKQEIRDECKISQQHKASVQLLQTAVLSMKQIDSSSNASNNRVEDMNQGNEYRSSSSFHIKQPDFASTTTDQGATSTCTTTYPSSVQGRGSPMSKNPFTTSLSFLKLPHVKFGEKKIENCLPNSQNYRVGAEGPCGVSEDCPPQGSVVVSSPQTHHQNATPADCLNTIITPFSTVSQFSPIKSQHDPNEKPSRTPSTSTTCVIKSSSLPAGVMTSGSCQSFEPSTPRPRAVSCSFIPQSIRTSSPSTKTMTIPSRLCRGVSPYRFKSVKVPVLQSKCTDASVPRGLRIPHLKVRGVGGGGVGGRGQCLLSKYAGVPPSSRGPAETPSIQHKTFAIFSPGPYQKPFQNYSSPSLDKTDITLSLSTKADTCKEGLLEFHPSTDQSQDAINNNDTNAGVPSTDSLSGSCNTTPASDEDEMSPTSSCLPQPMEVDGSDSSDVMFEEISLNTSQEFKVTTDPTANEAQIQDLSPKAQHTDTYNKSISGMCSSTSMKSSSPKEKPLLPQLTECTITTTPMTSTPEKPLTTKPKQDTPPVSSVPSLSSHSPLPHIASSQPNKDQFQFSATKSLDYKKTPGTPNVGNRFQHLTTTTGSPVQDSGFSSLFQSSLQTSGGGSQPFNLFGSPVTNSPTQPSNETSQSNFFMFENSSNLREDNTNTGGLFNFNLGSDGESMDNNSSGFLSSLFDSSSSNNSASNDTSGFHLF